MHFDASYLDHFTSLARRHEPAGLSKFQPRSFQLGAAMELVVWRVANAGGTEFGNCIDAWANDCPILSTLLGGLRGHERNIPGAGGSFGMVVIDGADALGNGFAVSMGAFQHAIVNSGVPLRLAQAVTGAFGEMADNVLQHSQGDTELATLGVAAWQISGQRQFAYTVADTGIGALESLRQNPKWANLESPREALEAIATDGASRRQGQGQGLGYRELFAALVSFDGTLRIRSDTGRFQLVGSLGECEGLSGDTTPLPGYQISVECRF